MTVYDISQLKIYNIFLCRSHRLVMLVRSASSCANSSCSIIWKMVYSPQCYSMYDLVNDLISFLGPANKTTSGLFHLDRVSGVLTTTSNAFDRDILTGGTEYYDIQVMATDQGGWSATAQTIRIMISDVNDNPPMFTETVYHVEISEQEGAGEICTQNFFSSSLRTSSLITETDCFTPIRTSPAQTYVSCDEL